MRILQIKLYCTADQGEKEANPSRSSFGRSDTKQGQLDAVAAANPLRERPQILKKYGSRFESLPLQLRHHPHTVWPVTSLDPMREYQVEQMLLATVELRQFHSWQCLRTGPAPASPASAWPS